MDDVSPDIDERMAALTWEQWEHYIWAVTSGECREDAKHMPEYQALVARLREKLDGLSPGQLKSLVTCAKRPSRVLHGARLASLGFVDDGVAMGDGIYRAIRFQGRAALRLEADRGWRCACGDPIMLADTDEWPTPCCYSCWEKLTPVERERREGTRG